MPLSEFYRLVDGNNESPTLEPTNISYMPDDDFVELVWEKGQIMMQGQSSKAKKTPVSSNFQFHTSKSQEKDGLLDIEMGLNQDDDLVPWLTYPLDDYCSDLLPEISGVTVNKPTSQNVFNLVDKKDIYNNQIDKGSNAHHGVSLDQSKVSSFLSCKNNVINGDPIQGQLKASKQDSSSSSLLNFSHFSRPAVMARASFQNNNSLLGDSGPSGSQKAMGFISKPLASEPHCGTGRGDTTNVARDATEKSVEPIGASSSVCSGNSAERASNDLTKYSKRKAHDMEDSECQSEDVEEESLGIKKAATSRVGTGSKRSRAAEVHNLSERRRRDRINEKMRALQELIPNCNKVDKASMLDEAIEYLKTLQVQVQIMSMGSGLCMPPMMFSSGMHSGHVPHFSPMGMSYGMGMVDINGGSSPSTQRYPLPSPPVSGLNTFYGQGMPFLFPQPPAVRHMGAPLQVPNSHLTSMQFQGANEGLAQPSSVDKKSQPPEVGCSTAVSPPNSNNRLAGCDRLP